MKKVLFFLFLSFLFTNISVSEEVDCTNINDCLSKNYIIKNQNSFNFGDQLVTIIYDLEKKREKILVQCSVTYYWKGLKQLYFGTQCFKP